MSEPIGLTRPAPRTALAFSLAPGIAGMVGGVGAVFYTLCTAGTPVSALVIPAIFVFWSFMFSIVGYLTAVFIAMPIYLLLSESARGCFALVVPLAGVIAAAPWILADPPWSRGAGSLELLQSAASALGCIGGIAFVSIRRPAVRIDGGETPTGSSRASSAL